MAVLVEFFSLFKSTCNSRWDNEVAKPKIPWHLLPSWLMSYPTHTAIQAGGDKPPTAKDMQGPNICREGSRMPWKGTIRGTWEHGYPMIASVSTRIRWKAWWTTLRGATKTESFAQPDTRWRLGTPTDWKGLGDLATGKAYKWPTGALFQDRAPPGPSHPSGTVAAVPKAHCPFRDPWNVCISLISEGKKALLGQRKCLKIFIFISTQL